MGEEYASTPGMAGRAVRVAWTVGAIAESTDDAGAGGGRTGEDDGALVGGYELCLCKLYGRCVEIQVLLLTTTVGGGLCVDSQMRCSG
jgi:hypothetical protein